MSLGKGLKLAARADFLALSAFELGLLPTLRIIKTASGVSRHT